MIAARIDDLRSSGVGVVVVEAFGLIEAGWDRLVDRVWVTVASEKAVLDRLEKQRDLPEADVLARIRSQMSNEERAKYADVVIRNEGTPEELKAIVGQMWDSHLRDFSAGKAGPRQGKESERTIDK
jgi:dephospho-CoA kinase